MQYMLLNYVVQADFAEAGQPDSDPQGPAWSAYTQALIAAGVMRGGNALQPAASAATVRLRDGRRDVQDGPFADSKEQLGGYYVIDVPDLDTALAWAARSPAASTGAVEVRPVFAM